MTVLQEVLFEVESDYLGHPYHVSGNALFSALAQEVGDGVRASLQVSAGVFVPGTHGEYPKPHSESGGCVFMGTGLRSVERYDDLFVFRDAAQRWVSASRPRDACNTHELRSFGGRVAFAPMKVFGRPPSSRNSKRSMTWFVHCYLHTAADGDDVLPLGEEVLSDLRLGGARNYGFGSMSLKDSQLVDLEELDYSRIEAADAVSIELLSPYVVESEFPGAASQSVPWWWEPREAGLRRRSTRLVRGDEAFDVATVDHGQVVGYAGRDQVETAKNGVLRVGTHSKYGFGEFRLRPVSGDRVEERVSSPTSP